MAATAQLAFLPWVRQGVATAIGIADTGAADMRGVVDLTAALSVNGSPAASVPLRLRGPADVIGIHPHEIVRVDPRPGSGDFEPNYFPSVEFDRPDFPWLFTPARADANARLRPWICLVVVRKQLGVQVRPAADERLPVLEIAKPATLAHELPDLADSWAWAHAQTATPADAVAVRAALGGPTEQSLSRLLSPRILAPLTDYVACVVPTFDLGRRAGLGDTIKQDEITDPHALAPAWSIAPPADAVTLPVYFMWEFRTGEGGDFQSLVERLHAEPAPPRLGVRAFGIGRPGFDLPPEVAVDATLDLQAALQPIEPTEPPATWTVATAHAFQARLAPIVNMAGNSELLDPATPPLLAPPLYGRWHAAKPMAAIGGTTWFETLNMDPRHRVAAALGTRVIQEHQEALMAAAWAQAGDLQQANERVRRLQLSVVVNTSLHARHFARLGPEAIVRIGTPAFGRVRPAASGGTTLAATVASSALPLDAASAPMRRLGRQRGPLTRRIAQQGAARILSRSWITAFNVPTLAPLAGVYLLGTFNALLRSLPPSTPLSGYIEITDATMAAAGGRPTFRVVPEGEPVLVTPPENLPPSSDNAAAKAFRAAAVAHLARLNPGRLSYLTAPPPPLSVGSVRDLFLAGIHPRRTIKALTEAVVSAGPGATQPTDTAADTSDVETIMAAPRFTQPMYESLRDLGQELLLPGLDAVTANVVLGLKTNRRFVEAYMVGLNVEMARELLWRGYPTDQRVTCFDQFWDARTSLLPRPDISPMHEWRDRALGDASGAPARERFVMLLRSDLLRRYPSAIIYAVPAVVHNGKRKPDDDAAKEVYPAFRGSLLPDVAFFGFDLTTDQVIGDALTGGYYILIQEHAGEPRFGLDVGVDAGGVSYLALDAGAPAGVALHGLQWGGTAAEMAGITRQLPVRIAIHASRFVKKH